MQKAMSRCFEISRQGLPMEALVVCCFLFVCWTSNIFSGGMDSNVHIFIHVKNTCIVSNKTITHKNTYKYIII